MAQKNHSSKLGSPNRVGIVIVAYKNEQHILKLVKTVRKQMRRDDRLVIVDNYSPKHPCADLLKTLKTPVNVIRKNNVGFGGGCNIGASAVIDDVDLLVFLNPDTTLAPGALDELRSFGSKWGGWMGLLMLPNGKVNSAGNKVHISGLSWVDGYKEPASLHYKTEEVTVLSGADTVVTKEAWSRIGGFHAEYFLYYEDTDLSFRLRLMGYDLGLVPTAHVIHDYDFGKGGHKWFYIERNRYLFMWRCWPMRVLLVLLPFIIFSEVGLWLVSIIERRFLSKVKASLLFLKMIPAATKQRRKIMKSRKISDYEFYALLEPEIDTPLLPIFNKFPAINGLFKYYYRVAGALLRAIT